MVAELKEEGRETVVKGLAPGSVNTEALSFLKDIGKVWWREEGVLKEGSGNDYLEKHALKPEDLGKIALDMVVNPGSYEAVHRVSPPVFYTEKPRD